MKSKIDLYVSFSVRKKRMELGWSQKALAKKLKVSPGFIGMVESKSFKSYYSIDHINKLSLIFKCSPRDFVPVNPL